MPSLSQITAIYLALAAARFLTGARAAAIQGAKVEKCGFYGPIPSPSPVSNATKRQENAENVTSLADILGPPLSAGEEEPRPKDPEKISGKPPPSDDGRVLNIGVYMHVVGISDKNNASAEFLLSIDALNKYYKQANIPFQLLDADWTNDHFLRDESPC